MGKIFQTVDISTHLGEFENQVYVVANDNELGASDPSVTVLVDNGGIVYELAESKDYYICTGIKGPLSGEIVIKSLVTTPDGSELYVREIAPNAFEYNLDITGVTLPMNLRTLGESAFKGCSNLGSVGVGGLSSFTTIGDYAFADCIKLAKITIPKSMRTVGTGAFMNCTKLEQVTMLSGTERIGEDAFNGCIKLRSITIPSSVKSIGNTAFYHTDLTTINVPSSVTYLGDGVFTGCTSARTATLGAGISYIPERTFYGCPQLTTVTLPSSIDQIGSEAFRYCESLAGITIPASVKYIGTFAFKECINLEEVVFENPYGWFYTDLVGIPFSVIVGENCTHIPTITPLLLKQSFTKYGWFRLEKMQAPAISVDAETGILSILDNTGLADSYDIWINDQKVLSVTAKNEGDEGPKAITAGTYVAKNDFVIPPVGTTYNLKFRTAQGEGSTQNCVQIHCINDDLRTGEPMILYATSYDGPESGGLMLLYVEGGRIIFPNNHTKTIYVDSDQIVGDNMYEWFTSSFELVN